MNRLNFLIILLIFVISNAFAGGGGKAYMPIWRNYSNGTTNKWDRHLFLIVKYVRILYLRCFSLF